MHLAGVLADGVLPSLTRESLDRSYGPKARQNLRVSERQGFLSQISMVELVSRGGDEVLVFF